MCALTFRRKRGEIEMGAVPGEASEEEDHSPNRAHSHVPVQRAGFLTKRGKVRKTWKRRWFVLSREQKLYYYTSQTSKSPQGMINLHEATILDFTNSGKENGFEINTPGRVWYLHADDPYEKDLWIKEIRNAIQVRERVTLSM